VKTTTRFMLPGVLIPVALVLAACSNGTSPAGGSPTPRSTSMTVSTSSVSGLGTVLTAPDGHTLYLLTADKNGTPTCTSSPCTGIWQPLLVSGGGSPTAGSGVKAGLLGTVGAMSGSEQVTYDNWPVYLYSGDSAAGQANGEKIKSFGGTWFAVGASGKPAGVAGGSSSGGGWG
jgi:predicted lipoprotein with Yx(FWY)xxD motif